MLRRRLYGSADAFDEVDMHFIRPLGPDAAAAALGELFEVGRARLDRGRNRLILHEQPLEGLAGCIAGDALLNSDSDVPARFDINRHGQTLRSKSSGKRGA